MDFDGMFGYAFEVFGYQNSIKAHPGDNTIWISGCVDGDTIFETYNVKDFCLQINGKNIKSGRKQEFTTVAMAALFGFGVIIGPTPPPNGITIESIQIIFTFKNYSKTIWKLVPNPIGWYSDMQSLADVEFDKIYNVCQRLQQCGLTRRN